MLQVGDSVVFLRDGTRGIIMQIRDSLYQVIWEDHFVSWEKEEQLEKLPEKK
jgi:hypothetical protein